MFIFKKRGNIMKNSDGRVIMLVLLLAAFAVVLAASLTFAAPPITEPAISDAPPPLPDVEAYNLEVDRLNAKPGDIVLIKGYYMVKGCVKTLFSGKITINGNTLIEQEMTNFSANCEMKMWDAMFGGSWKAVPGTHTFTFYADSKEDIHESNEQNNTKSITVIVPSVEMIEDLKEKHP
jgi:hypothetical protein